MVTRTSVCLANLRILAGLRLLCLVANCHFLWKQREGAQIFAREKHTTSTGAEPQGLREHKAGDTVSGLESSRLQDER